MDRCVPGGGASNQRLGSHTRASGSGSGRNHFESDRPMMIDGRNWMRSSLVAFLGVFVCVPTIFADDVYVLQGEAIGGRVPGGNLSWSSDAVLYNGGSTDALVRLVGTSVGSDNSGPTEISIPRGRTANIPGTVYWRAAGPLWVLRIEAPSDVSVAGFLNIGFVPDQSPASFHDAYGRTQLPVVRKLVPAGGAQIHLGTDLGRDRAMRLNVGIYNAAASSASATIQVRDHCDFLLEEQVVAIPANTVLQFPIAPRRQDCDPGSPGEFGGPSGYLYTLVTVDQPGFSFVSVLSTTELPRAKFGFSWNE